MPNIKALPLSTNELWPMLVSQKYVKGQSQGHIFKIYGTIGKALSLRIHMPNMKAPSFRTRDQRAFYRSLIT